MIKRIKQDTPRFMLLLIALMLGIPIVEARSRHCHSHHGHHHGRRYCGGGYWGGGWGYPYWGWGYGWPYYGYGWPYYGGPTVVRVSDDRTVRVVDRTYQVTNKTNRVLRVSTTRESKTVQPGDMIRLKYSQKVLNIASDKPHERIQVRPRSRRVTIFEAENGTLRIED